MKIITKMIEEDLYEASNENGNLLIIDMRDPALKTAQSPVELLLSSLSACGAIDIVQILRKRKKSIESFTIETKGERRSEAPRAFTSIHCKYIVVSPDVEDDELQKASKLSLEKYCSVAASLNANISFSVEVLKPK